MLHTSGSRAYGSMESLICERSAGNLTLIQLKSPEKESQERSSSRLVFTLVADARSAPSAQIMPAVASSYSPSRLPTSGKLNALPFSTVTCHVLSSDM